LKSLCLLTVGLFVSAVPAFASSVTAAAEVSSGLSYKADPALANSDPTISGNPALKQAVQTNGAVSAPIRARRRETPWGKVILWVCTASIGSLLTLIGFIGVVDPAGTKRADDSDPFGPPGGRVYPAVITVIGIALVLWPLVPHLGRRQQEPAEHDRGAEEH